MKLLYVAPRYYPHVGGVEYVVKSVAERLAMRGHEVTVLCGEKSVEGPMEERVNGIEANYRRYYNILRVAESKAY
ncbi:MAG: glycosyltransferase, partial [Nitrososphaerales archaeon]